MLFENFRTSESGDRKAPHRWWRALTQNSRPGIFIGLVLISGSIGAVNGIRINGVFACQSANPDANQYLAYCQATGFGDYDHGAFWFNLEGKAVDAASRAKVLFLGNSRMQFGLSSEYLDEWFASQAISYYLLGFSHMENYRFALPLVAKLRPAANAYVVNVDLFFEDRLSPPANDIMTNKEALNRYLEKRRWQYVHETLCKAAAFLCRKEVAFFRTRSNGAWVRKGGEFSGRETLVSYDDTVDKDMLARYERLIPNLINGLGVKKNCIILTNTPQSGTSIGTATAFANRLNLPLVAPRIDGLKTFDGSHLDPGSATRWSAAFIESIAPHLRNCLGDSAT